MTDEALTEDERELLLMVAACYSPRPPGRPEPWEAILAHYRKAKATVSDCPRCGEVGCMVLIHPDCNGSPRREETIPVYTAADGSLWVEDPDGTHGWWSVEPGSDDIEGETFAPWERGYEGTHHGTWIGSGAVLRYYRRVEKKYVAAWTQQIAG